MISEVGMSKEVKNRSITYLLPIALDNIDLNKGAVVNSYIYSIHSIELNTDRINGLFIKLLYELESKETFKDIERCKSIKDIDDKCFLVFIEFPTRFLPDVDLIIKGKYSKINKEAKDKIVNYYKLTETSKIFRILTKSPILRVQLEDELHVSINRNAELGSIFDMKNEVFTQDIIETNKINKTNNINE